jgi:hypothetical protein
MLHQPTNLPALPPPTPPAFAKLATTPSPQCLWRVKTGAPPTRPAERIPKVVRFLSRQRRRVKRIQWARSLFAQTHIATPSRLVQVRCFFLCPSGISAVMCLPRPPSPCNGGSHGFCELGSEVGMLASATAHHRSPSWSCGCSSGYWCSSSAILVSLPISAGL